MLVAEGVQRCRASEWLAGLMGGVRAARGLCDWPFNQAALDGPQPTGLNEPLLTAPESLGRVYVVFFWGGARLGVPPIACASPLLRAPPPCSPVCTSTATAPPLLLPFCPLGSPSSHTQQQVCVSLRAQRRRGCMIRVVGTEASRLMSSAPLEGQSPCMSLG